MGPRPDDEGVNSLASRFRVDVLLLVVAASWGSTYLVTKELVTPASVMALLALRMLLAAAIMAVAVVAGRALRRGAARKSSGFFSHREFGVGVVLGVLLAAVFVCETFGIAHTSATNAGLIISLTVVFTPILESLVTGRRLPASFFLAALVAVAGVALLAGVGAFRAPSLGDLLVLGAAVIRAVHVVAMHRLTEGGGAEGRGADGRCTEGTGARLDTLTLTTVQLATCAVLFTAACLLFGESLPDYLASLDLSKLTLFAYLVVVCTVFAFFVQMWAVRRTSPARVSLLLGTEPLWATAIGVGIARDGLDLTGWCGVLLVLAGTFWGRRIEQRQREGMNAAQPHTVTAHSERLPGTPPRRLR
jgi:drug/metabolite transporter (DMT)-like permease